MTVLRGSALAIALLGTACAVDGPRGSIDDTGVARQGIIAGQPSDPGEFPATGMIVIGDSLICTATLIAPDVVLTAAHCLGKPIFGSYGFTLDTDGADGTDNVIPATVWHQHPGFDDRVDEFVDLAIRNDVGVLLLDHPILDVTPEKIELPSDGDLVPPGAELSLVGYGRFVWHTGDLALKRDAQVFVDRSESHEFSTTAVDPQPCNGDSGGPLFAETPKGRRIVGLVSRAVGSSQMCDTGAIITRVQPYDDWIYLASHDHNTGGCNAGGGGGAALPFGLLGVAVAIRRRRRSAR
jgi:uncharacterized protein (TIGR03382 family)